MRRTNEPLERGIRVDYRSEFTAGTPVLHNHTHYDVSVILQGRVTVINNEARADCTAPCVLLHFPGTFHCVLCDETVRYERYNINFPARLFPKNPELLSDTEQLFQANLTLLSPTPEQAETLAYYIRPMLDAGDELRERLLAVVTQLLTGCARNSAGQGGHPIGCVNQAIGVIAQNLTPNMTAAELAAACHVSRAKLTADFKRETGMTIKEYIALQCVERGKHLLAKGQSVREAAAALRYVDEGTFIRVFKKITGVTPGKWVQTHVSG